MLPVCVRHGRFDQSSGFSNRVILVLPSLKNVRPEFVPRPAAIVHPIVPITRRVCRRSRTLSGTYSAHHRPSLSFSLSLSDLISCNISLAMRSFRFFGFWAGTTASSLRPRLVGVLGPRQLRLRQGVGMRQAGRKLVFSSSSPLPGFSSPVGEHRVMTTLHRLVSSQLNSSNPASCGEGEQA